MATRHALIASLSYSEIIIPAICFLCFVHFLRRLGHPRDWSVVGILSVWFPILGHVYDNLAESLVRKGGTILIKRSLFCNMDVIFTGNPANLHHIMSTNFSNYPKGPQIKSIFDVYGEMLFTADHDVWKKHRRATNALFNDPRIQTFNQKVNRVIIEKQLIPFLDHASENGLVVDLQNVFKRLMLDATCMMATGYQHGSLCIGLPHDDVLEAIDAANQQVFMRHVLPEKLWKFQRWLGIGGEKKMRKAWKVLDDTAAKYVTWRNTQSNLSTSTEDVKDELDAVRFSNENVVKQSVELNHSMLRDTVKGLLLAGTDTTGTLLSWFFWLLVKNPGVVFKIREEMEEKLRINVKVENPRALFSPEDLNKLFYLHAAIYEALRLFPPAPFQSRTSVGPDILPSGHRIDSNTRVVLAYYAMGRMESIWGDDCNEFKPERWLSEKGTIIPMQSNKFLAFGSGPRSCPGKELAMNRLKAVAAAIIPNYGFQMVKDNPGTPATSAILCMKDGPLVRITKMLS